MVDQTIYFYIHPEFWPRSAIPSSPDVGWAGFDHGIYTWTIQTFLRLRKAGVPCELVSEVPESGIVIAHRESLSAVDGKYKGSVNPTRTRFIVDMCADLYPYRKANLHIVQNPAMTRFGPAFIYVRHWPQPAMIPRDSSRALMFKNIAYYGNRKNLSEQLLSIEWERSLSARGLNWFIKSGSFDYTVPSTYLESGSWRDYSEVDAIVAIRNFSQVGKVSQGHKPASKLYNAWLAGIPAILGREYCYQQERKSELDYIEANDGKEALECLDRLRNDPDLRVAMSANGHRRGLEVGAEMTTKAWQGLIADRFIPAYREWLERGFVDRNRSSLKKQLMYQVIRAKGVILQRFDMFD